MGKSALLIGVSEYSEQLAVPPLPSALEDVQAMQTVLQQSCGFASEDITALTNPNRNEIEENLYHLFADRRPEDLLVFYFSGHGLTDSRGHLYFATPKTKKDQKGRLLKYTAVAASVLHENMGESKSQYQTLILDCCYSGAIAKGMTLKDDGSIDFHTQLGGKGRAILTSSSAVQRSFHLNQFKCSLYTHYLVEGLKTGKADLDKDGRISLDELHDYVSTQIQQTVPGKMMPQFLPVKEGYRIVLAQTLLPPSPDINLDKLKADAFQSFFLKDFEQALKLWQEFNLLAKTPEDRQLAEQMIEQVIPDRLGTTSPVTDEPSSIVATSPEISTADEASPTTSNASSTLDDIPLESEKGVDYRKLRDLLKAQNWQEADHETYLRMLEAVGREKGDWIRKEELLNFPCKDLKTIDRLWVTASNGHFGFSVQQKIYVQCGGKLDGSKSDDSIWRKFGDTVGWRVEGKWIDYDSVTFNTSSPRGHLPWGVGWLVGGVWSLLSHRDL